MATHTVEPTRENVHGTFSRELPPILTIESGDTVEFRTLDAGWNIEPRKTASPQDRPAKIEPRNPEKDSGHCLCGPIAIAGAEPGMTLEVKIESIEVGTWGWHTAGGWSHEVHERMGTVEGGEDFHLWALDRDRNVGTDQHGHEIKLRPFMGVMGMPPDEPGLLSTAPPRATG